MQHSSYDENAAVCKLQTAEFVFYSLKLQLANCSDPG